MYTVTMYTVTNIKERFDASLTLRRMHGTLPLLLLLLSSLLFSGCSHTYQAMPTATPQPPVTTSPEQYEYLIGPGDKLNVFVWRNQELSGTFTVRPDGKVTTPLAEDLNVAGKSPATVASELEQVLGKYLKEPVVTIIVDNFIGPFSEQVRVVGAAAHPKAIAYRKGMTLLDVMIAVGGLTTFADGNDARVIRNINGAQQPFSVRLDDLLREGDISANADILPGDILVIPETWF